MLRTSFEKNNSGAKFRDFSRDIISTDWVNITVRLLQSTKSLLIETTKSIDLRLNHHCSKN